MYFRFYLFTSPDGVNSCHLSAQKHVTCKPYLIAGRLGGTRLSENGHVIIEYPSGVEVWGYSGFPPCANRVTVLIFPHYCLSVSHHPV